MTSLARYSAVIVILLGFAACHDAEVDKERRHALIRLADPRPVARIDAIRRLAEKADRTEATAIAKAAKDAPAEVRVEVALALGRAPVPEAIDLLGSMIRDS